MWYTCFWLEVGGYINRKRKWRKKSFLIKAKINVSGERSIKIHPSNPVPPPDLSLLNLRVFPTNWSSNPQTNKLFHLNALRHVVFSCPFHLFKKKQKKKKQKNTSNFINRSNQSISFLAYPWIIWVLYVYESLNEIFSVDVCVVKSMMLEYAGVVSLGRLRGRRGDSRC